jgi:dTDP-4-dehydrorhamnose reductase
MIILLFGSSGMLGHYVYKVLNDKYNVICINRQEYDISQDSWNKLNTIMKPLKENDIIINCAGIIPQKTNQNDYTSYIKVNALFPHKLNEYSKERNIKFIHITTDCVFDGLKGNYSEQDKHTANTLYGISKSLGEPAEATIIRTSIIGEEQLGKKSLIEWVISNKDKQINGFTNHFWNGVTCLTLAEIIKKIITENLFWKGVKHVFSPDIVTKYDLCKYINDIYHLNINIIPVNDNMQKNMTLCSNDDGVIVIFNPDKIYNQISRQKGV